MDHGSIAFSWWDRVHLVSRRWFPRTAEYDLEPELSITRKNGWALLDLVLRNNSELPIWAEQATFAVADLDADFQGAVATNEGTLIIREDRAARRAARANQLD